MSWKSLLGIGKSKEERADALRTDIARLELQLKTGRPSAARMADAYLTPDEIKTRLGELRTELASLTK